MKQPEKAWLARPLPGMTARPSEARRLRLPPWPGPPHSRRKRGWGHIRREVWSSGGVITLVRLELREPGGEVSLGGAGYKTCLTRDWQGSIEGSGAAGRPGQEAPPSPCSSDIHSKEWWASPVRRQLICSQSTLPLLPQLPLWPTEFQRGNGCMACLP